MSEWISVKDRLPEEGYDMYQVYCQILDCYGCLMGWQDIVHYEDGEFYTPIHDNENGKWIRNEIHNNVVTHWMPLTQPPKEAENATTE